MANTEFLAQFLGVFSVILGVSMLLRPRVVVSALDEIFSSRGITYVIGLLEVLGGVLIIVSHSVWSSVLASVVSFLGWLLLLEGLLYILSPQKTLGNISKRFHNHKIYLAVAFCYIVLGVYLMWASFGSLPPILSSPAQFIGAF